MSSIEARILQYYTQVDRSVGIHPKTGMLHVDRNATDVISDLFARNAVYERDGWPAFKGKAAIDEFFQENRALCGQHKVEDMAFAAGIPAGAEAKLRAHFPALSHAGCRTLVVTGTFAGAQCHAEKQGAARFVRGASGLEIPFCDYWVFSGDKILFRYSQMHDIAHAARASCNSNWERM